MYGCVNCSTVNGDTSASVGESYANTYSKSKEAITHAYTQTHVNAHAHSHTHTRFFLNLFFSCIDLFCLMQCRVIQQLHRQCPLPSCNNMRPPIIKYLYLIFTSNIFLFSSGIKVLRSILLPPIIFPYIKLTSLKLLHLLDHFA